MRRLLTLATIVLLIAAATASGALAKVPGFGVQAVCACGGHNPPTVVWTLITWPNGYTQPAYCERHWSNGTVTYGPC
jgi:hypothetical protein